MGKYLGNDEIVDTRQVIRYLQDNYVDAAGNPLTVTTAQKLVENADQDKISSAIRVFRSHVNYVGDEIVKDADVPYTWVEPDDEDYEDDE